MRSAISILTGTGILLSLAACSHIGPLHGYTIASKSMEPTLYEGDKIIADESYYSSHRIADGDLVVFRHNGFVLIKRVTATAGETIESREGVLFRNNHALDEPYAHHSGEPSPELQTFAVRTVPSGELFVTGDNRDFSLDSRLSEFGLVHALDVLGVPTYIQSSNHGGSGRQLK
ncbi:MAG: signal peptidase I [Acidobacteriota bacterium]|nr:signal peptidase I [Acidobacteriota bacterium]